MSLSLLDRTAGLGVRLATTDAEVAEAQRLRHKVFVAELGAVPTGDGVESDRFDGVASHLLLLDETRPEGSRVVGATRLLDGAGAAMAGGFYSEAEFDLGRLRSGGRRLLELGRSCIDPAYRGGLGLGLLWQGLAAHVRATGTEVLFGVASFHGARAEAHLEALRLLATAHAAPADLRPVSRQASGLDLSRPPADRRAATLAVPGLIRSYLRLGGGVGEGAFEDGPFNTTDVCMVLDTARLTPRGRALLGGADPGRGA